MYRHFFLTLTIISLLFLFFITLWLIIGSFSELEPLTLPTILISFFAIYLSLSNFENSRKPLLVSWVSPNYLHFSKDEYMDNSIFIKNISRNRADSVKVTFRYSKNGEYANTITEHLDYLNPGEIADLIIDTDPLTKRWPGLFEVHSTTKQGKFYQSVRPNCDLEFRLEVKIFCRYDIFAFYGRKIRFLDQFVIFLRPAERLHMGKQTVLHCRGSFGVQNEHEFNAK